MRIYAVTSSGIDQAEALASVKVYATQSSWGLSTKDDDEPEQRAIAEAGKEAVKAYAVRGGTGVTKVQEGSAAGYGRVLVSYVYDKGRAFPARMQRYGFDAAKLDLLLDSGAFSVWSRNESVNLEEYIAWAKAYYEEQPFVRIANLDVIPGLRGRKPTKAERDSAIAEGMANADRMREAGLPIIEAYHRFEPMEVLDEIVNRRRPNEVIAIGGLVGRGSVKDKRKFCDGVFARLKELSGGWGSLIPVHGFGVAPDSPLAQRYPWYSIDAATWVLSRKFGKEVGSDGSWTGRTDRRTSVKPLVEYYFQATLANWRRREESYTKLWHERGVRFALEEKEVSA